MDNHCRLYYSLESKQISYCRKQFVVRMGQIWLFTKEPIQGIVLNRTALDGLLLVKSQR